jgi:uncharacterized protein (DUF488 family)
MALGILYTVGYRRHSPSELRQVLPGVELVVDVRRRAWSGNPAWSTRTRQTIETLGFRYRHDPRLGNLDYRTGGIRVSDIDAIEDVLTELRAGTSVALMCACSNVTSCHRRSLAAEAQRREDALVVVDV